MKVHLKTHSHRLHDAMLHGLFACSLKCEYMLNRKKKERNR
jgi:hypothetical protein